MTAKQFVADLAEGARVDAPFVVRSREMRAARTGEAYLTFELADRTGRISAVIFRPDDRVSAIPTGAVVRAVGRVTSFRGMRRVSLDSVRATSQWDRRDMVASSPRPRTEVIAELREVVRGVREPGLRSLLKAIFGDRAFFGAFTECPGSQSYHHAYLGGLLEHTVTKDVSSVTWCSVPGACVRRHSRARSTQPAL